MKNFLERYIVRASTSTIALFLLCTVFLVAAVPQIWYSLNVPVGGFIQDHNVSSASCVGTNSSGVYTYATCPPTPYPTPTQFTNLVCTGAAVCSPSSGPTPAIFVATPGPSPSSNPYDINNATQIAPTAMPTSGAYTVYATPSATTGISTGTVGAWRGVITYNVIIFGNGTAGNTQNCIAGATAGTNAIHLYTTSGGTVCGGSASNPLSGMENVGYTSTLSSYTGVSPQTTVYSAQFPNSTSLSFSCESLASSVTAPIIAGYCTLQLYPI